MGLQDYGSSSSRSNTITNDDHDHDHETTRPQPTTATTYYDSVIICYHATAHHRPRVLNLGTLKKP